MYENDVLYSGNTDGTASSPPGPAVRISSTQPSSELPGSQQQLVSNGRSKVTWERVLLVVLGVLLAAAVITLRLTSYKNMELTQKLTDELDAVRRNLTAYKNMELHQNLTDKLDGLGKVTDDSRPQCEEGWEWYYFSTDKATWEESKRQCKCRGGNLVKIGSREEQEFLVMILKGIRNGGEEYFWMGLTDSKEEGTWLWADDSPLNPSLVFWRPGEPDDWKGDSQFPDGEDCAGMYSNNGVEDLKSWFDRPCGLSYRYICDKPAQTSHLKCV